MTSSIPLGSRVCVVLFLWTVGVAPRCPHLTATESVSLWRGLVSKMAGRTPFLFKTRDLYISGIRVVSSGPLLTWRTSLELLGVVSFWFRVVCLEGLNVSYAGFVVVLQSVEGLPHPCDFGLVSLRVFQLPPAVVSSWSLWRCSSWCTFGVRGWSASRPHALLFIGEGFTYFVLCLSLARQMLARLFLPKAGRIQRQHHEEDTYCSLLPEMLKPPFSAKNRQSELVSRFSGTTASSRFRWGTFQVVPSYIPTAF